MKVYLINDADAAGLGEYICGAARGERLFVVFTLGTGFGSSVIVDGKPWLGSAGISPELGHLPIFSGEKFCGCGREDHVESRLSSHGLWRGYFLESGEKNCKGKVNLGPIEDLFDADKNGDMAARLVIDNYAEDLGKMIATVAIAYALKVIVLNGGISSAWDRLKNIAMKAVEKYGFLPLTDDLQIRQSNLGDDAALIGAASMIHK